MRFTKDFAVAMLAFASSIAASPRLTWGAGGLANHTHAATITRSHNVSSNSIHAARVTHPHNISLSSTHAARIGHLHNVSPSSTHAVSPTAGLVRRSPGPEHDKMIEFAVYTEEGPIFDGLGCLVSCWVETKKNSEGKSAYGKCRDHCKAPTKPLSAGERAHKVAEAAAEVGVKLRNDIVDYSKCILEKDSQACVVKIMEKHVPDSVESGAHKGGGEYGTEEEAMQTISTMTTKPAVAASTATPAKEPSKTIESTTKVEESTATDGRIGDAPASSSVMSVTSRPSPNPVET